MDAAHDPGTRLLMIGPMPPPLNGQSEVMRHVVARIGPHFPRLRVEDVGAGGTSGRLGALARAARSIVAWRSIRGSDAVYVAVKADHGMWLTTATVALARLSGSRVFLHHHSYAYVGERKTRMVALAHVAGTDARHVVLSRSMAADLRRVMPEIRHTPVVGNAGLIDTSLLGLPLRADGGELILGHLSNLSQQKGIAEVVDLACALRRSGTRARLVVGGPVADDHARTHLHRAERELGDLFEYRGALTGPPKREFFGEITHFVFPSRYVHEASPMVLYEAMASGAVCIATRRGSICEQLAGSPALLARDHGCFVDETLPALVGAVSSATASRDTRRAYLRALDESESQLADLAAQFSRSD